MSAKSSGTTSIATISAPASSACWASLTPDVSSASRRDTLEETVRTAVRTARTVGVLRRDGRLLRGRDEVAHRPLVAPAQQLDGVGLAVDDALEERLAVLVGGQRALGPAARLVEQHGQARVRLAVLLGDLALDALGQRRRCARRGDRDGQRARAQDRRKDEVAQRRDV